eukprot:scaffold66804_cov31-Tisochrysis_lutea.AAC.1
MEDECMKKASRVTDGACQQNTNTHTIMPLQSLMPIGQMSVTSSVSRSTTAMALFSCRQGQRRTHHVEQHQKPSNSITIASPPNEPCATQAHDVHTSSTGILWQSAKQVARNASWASHTCRDT